jgi:glycosyltransferase involved in cell wall biosynthesis
MFGLMSSMPLVSVVMTTKDRPRFLPIGLACYQHQSYSRRELIVVDDGKNSPADRNAVEAVGGRLIRLATPTPLGTKLNHGIEASSGWLCQKMDDDDWYAPQFLERMVQRVLDSRAQLCRPTITFLHSFLFFEVAPWELRRSVANNIPGATLLFAREDWAQRPFRALNNDEDFWFVRDQVSNGAVTLPLPASESFIAVRHQGLRGDRGHTWTNQSDGRTLETYLEERPLYDRRPEELFPPWAVTVYRQLHEDLNAPVPA